MENNYSTMITDDILDETLEQVVNEAGNHRNFLYRDKKCGRICLSHAAQLPVLNERT